MYMRAEIETIVCTRIKKIYTYTCMCMRHAGLGVGERNLFRHTNPQDARLLLITRMSRCCRGLFFFRKKEDWIFFVDHVQRSISTT